VPYVQCQCAILEIVVDTSRTSTIPGHPNARFAQPRKRRSAAAAAERLRLRPGRAIETARGTWGNAPRTRARGVYHERTNSNTHPLRGA